MDLPAPEEPKAAVIDDKLCKLFPGEAQSALESPPDLRERFRGASPSVSAPPAAPEEAAKDPVAVEWFDFVLRFNQSSLLSFAGRDIHIKMYFVGKFRCPLTIGFC